MIKNPKNLSMPEKWRRTEMGLIFGMAPHLGIWFDDVEIKYIETKMMTHKLYRVLSGKMSGKYTSIAPRQYQTIIIWLESFLGDPNLPLGIKAFINYYIGAYQGDMKHDDEYDEKNRYKNYMAHRFLTELWMEKCR